MSEVSPYRRMAMGLAPLVPDRKGIDGRDAVVPRGVSGRMKLWLYYWTAHIPNSEVLPWKTCPQRRANRRKAIYSFHLNHSTFPQITGNTTKSNGTTSSLVFRVFQRCGDTTLSWMRYGFENSATSSRLGMLTTGFR